MTIGGWSLGEKVSIKTKNILEKWSKIALARVVVHGWVGWVHSMLKTEEWRLGGGLVEKWSTV